MLRASVNVHVPTRHWGAEDSRAPTDVAVSGKAREDYLISPAIGRVVYRADETHAFQCGPVRCREEARVDPGHTEGVVLGGYHPWTRIREADVRFPVNCVKRAHDCNRRATSHQRAGSAKAEAEAHTLTARAYDRRNTGEAIGCTTYGSRPLRRHRLRTRPFGGKRGQRKHERYDQTPFHASRTPSCSLLFVSRRTQPRNRRRYHLPSRSVRVSPRGLVL